MYLYEKYRAPGGIFPLAVNTCQDPMSSARFVGAAENYLA